MVKAAIFGGSFDPPHKGHQSIVQNALERLDIDRLIILPAFLNPFKKSSLASAEKRALWCHILFDAIEGVEVSEYEILAKKPVFTSQSIRHFQKLFDVRYLIIGSDNLASITKWHDFEWINSIITWVVIARKDHPVRTEMLRKAVILHLDVPVSSTDIRDNLRLDMIDVRIRDDVEKTLQQKGQE